MVRGDCGLQTASPVRARPARCGRVLTRYSFRDEERGVTRHMFGFSRKRSRRSDPISSRPRRASPVDEAAGAIPDYHDVAVESIRRSGVDASTVNISALREEIAVAARTQLERWAKPFPELGPGLHALLERPDYSATRLTEFLPGQASAKSVAIYNLHAESMRDQIPQRFSNALTPR